MADRTLTYKAYNGDGNFIGALNNITLEGFTKRLNGGMSTTSLIIAAPANDFGEGGVVELYNEIQVFIHDEFTGASGTQIYSGFLRSYVPISGREDSVRAEVVGYDNLMDLSLMYASSFKHTFGRTVDTDDHIKFIVDNYRAYHSDIDQNFETGEDADATFGAARYRAQKFTTGTTLEKALFTKASVYMRYNAGTEDTIKLSVYDDNAGEPGNELAFVTGDDTDSTSLMWREFILDTPLQLAASTVYWIVTSSDGASATTVYYWRQDSTSSGGADSAFSNDSGNNWTVEANKTNYHRTYYADESKVRINYDADSIDDSSDSIRIDFNKRTHKEALDYVLEHAPVNWHWFLGVDNTVQYHNNSTETLHTFTAGKDIEKIKFRKTVEDQTTEFLFSNNQPVGTSIAKLYSNAAAVASYGRRFTKRTDGRVTVAATANTIAASHLDTHKDPKFLVSAEINNYDIYSIEPGHRANIRNHPFTSSLDDNLIVQEIQYDVEKSTAIIELSALEPEIHNQIKKINRRLDEVHEETSSGQFEI